MPPGEEPEEAPDRGEVPRSGRVPYTLGRLGGQPGPDVGRAQRAQPRKIRFRAEVPRQEPKEAIEVALIGFDCQRRSAPLMREPRKEGLLRFLPRRTAKKPSSTCSAICRIFLPGAKSSSSIVVGTIARVSNM